MKAEILAVNNHVKARKNLTKRLFKTLLEIKNKVNKTQLLYFLFLIHGFIVTATIQRKGCKAFKMLRFMKGLLYEIFRAIFVLVVIVLCFVVWEQQKQIEDLKDRIILIEKNG